ncbi:MAG: hypothetical protein KUG77_02715, partial [Nannocystaceae bacterium]|nr:hypothetical protein [Nannocystaceae bacterium]
VAAGLAALFLLSFLGKGWMLAEAPPQNPQQAPDVRPDPDEPRTAEQVPTRPATRRSAVASMDPEPIAGKRVEPNAAPRRTLPQHTQEPPASSREGCGDDLKSVRMLRAAERLLSERPRASLAKLEQHAKRCPSSAFGLEREALWIRAACRVGGVPGVSQRRSRFSKRADVGVYRDGIARDCDGSR